MIKVLNYPELGFQCTRSLLKVSKEVCYDQCTTGCEMN